MLYEIPVYAFSQKELNKRVKQTIQTIKNRYSDCPIPIENLNRIIDMETRQCSRYRYNHIIGYIRIYHEGEDICGKVFLPVEEKKVIWNTKRKTFLRDGSANGLHFSINNLTNTGIKDEIETLVDLASTHFPHKSFIDREAFDSVNSFVDYKKLLQL